MKGATRPRSPAQWPVVPPALHLPFATSPCPVVPGDDNRGLVLDVTCRRVSISRRTPGAASGAAVGALALIALAGPAFNAPAHVVYQRFNSGAHPLTIPGPSSHYPMALL